MENLLYLLSAFGLAFLIKEKDGPFNVIHYIRSAILRNKYVGFFFLTLLSCYYCLGFWTGSIIFHLSLYENVFIKGLLFALASAGASYLLDVFSTKRMQNE